jgi:hypothetical protein
MKKDCLNCGKYLDTYERALNHYYLGRIHQCYGPIENLNADEECKDYVSKEEPFKLEYGGIRYWKKEDDGNIYPYHFEEGGHLYEIWFYRGWHEALKTISKIKKECSTCYYKSKHLVTQCIKNELCEKYEINYLLYFDRTFYGHLCDCCSKEELCDKNKDLIYNCKEFIYNDKKLLF